MKSISSDQGKSRKRVVVDTSVLISATLTDGPYRRLIRELINSDFEICIPQEVIIEYQRIVSEPKFKKYEPLFTEIFTELKKSSIILPPAKNKKYLIEGSKEDEGIINCCAENGVHYLISYDIKTVGKYNGLEVIVANEFYARFISN
ncbi:putative toxin-antitoxin system toxin component, PIN family [Candidatus Daviesbacteria bacterium RIFCSPLOWO2_01_FULL_39_12]|uniref:Putative toxin-antitoxin system toxin component, PIN family n=1 Tax=Candidatus Daviesbacteria bacterium RIFCSPLOWO2_01_FULL_39_12 TaxID=1797785 RepID=A0A1F5KM12_9BACT|nr:MAG: putative toxin-antitoxin system toxin component, PIN family [Candidatus Daviesbacteria bacterium RIFCSPHIGHO2_02_FULL_39_8]OGE41987.1 MAG: putative toxin-antitoxin system toxin component, PIN family [Candidatus Daviesbacteria bacterium RIFCSPLOWO2_01_FULL_39_12]